MKPILSIMGVALFVSMLAAQTPKSPAPIARMHDTVQAKTMMEQGMPQFGGHEKGFHRFENNCGMSPGPGMGPNFREHALPAGAFCPMMHPRMHFFFARHLFHLGLLVFFVLGIINILLTIIVSLDMSRLGRFNGLWIPVILMAGIPGSVIYALFRIGDTIVIKDKQKS
jgi:hypothetical protein